MSERVVYRGVDRDHFRFREATRGVVRPREPHGLATPDVYFEEEVLIRGTIRGATVIGT